MSRYGALYASHAELTWTPVPRVQLLVTFKNADAAPSLDLIAAPIVSTPNIPFVDLVSGQSLLVNSIGGGNRELLPERRHTLTLSANVRPLRTDFFHATLSYESAKIRDQAGTLSTLTPAIESAFPDRFVRDADSQLVSVDLRPINFSSETQRTVKASLSFSGQVGRKPEKEKDSVKATGTYVNASLTPALRLEDRLVLRDGLAALDLLDGDNIAATGGRPRWDIQGDMGIFRHGLGVFVQSVWHSGSRSRSDIPTADLHFAGLDTTSVYLFADMDQITHKAPWAHQLTISARIENIADARPHVHDRTGQIPYSDQPAYLDPLGRVASLMVRKLF